MSGVRKHRPLGFTLVEIMIVLAVIALIVALALPGMIRARVQSRAKACQEHQIKLGWAVTQWALTNDSSVVPEWDDLVGAGLYLNRTPQCPTTNTPIAIPPVLEQEPKCPTDELGHVIGAEP